MGEGRSKLSLNGSVGKKFHTRPGNNLLMHVLCSFATIISIYSLLIKNKISFAAFDLVFFSMLRVTAEFSWFAFGHGRAHYDCPPQLQVMVFLFFFHLDTSFPLAAPQFL